MNDVSSCPSVGVPSPPQARHSCWRREVIELVGIHHLHGRGGALVPIKYSSVARELIRFSPDLPHAGEAAKRDSRGSGYAAAVGRCARGMSDKWGAADFFGLDSSRT